jgi:hypothetical protein
MNRAAFEERAAAWSAARWRGGRVREALGEAPHRGVVRIEAVHVISAQQSDFRRPFTSDYPSATTVHCAMLG